MDNSIPESVIVGGSVSAQSARQLGMGLCRDQRRHFGGSNGNRTLLWKFELQRLTDELGIPVTVCHFPPGTSKWNKIEHRLFSFITINWRGKPLRTYQTVVKLTAATTTKTGLEVQCEPDPSAYEKGRKISDEEMKTVKLRPHRIHGEWNYTIEPH